MKVLLRTLSLLSILVGLMDCLIAVISCFDACTSSSLLTIPIIAVVALTPYIVMMLMGYFLFLKAARHHVRPLLYFGVMSLFPLVMIFIGIMLLINAPSISPANIFGRVFAIIEPSLIFSAIVPIAIFIGTFFLAETEQPIVSLSIP